MKVYNRKIIAAAIIPITAITENMNHPQPWQSAGRQYLPGGGGPKNRLFDYNQFIVPRTQTDFFSVFQTGSPFGFGHGVDEMIMMINKVRFSHVVSQSASRKWCSF